MAKRYVCSCNTAASSGSSSVTDRACRAGFAHSHRSHTNLEDRFTSCTADIITMCSQMCSCFLLASMDGQLLHATDMFASQIQRVQRTYFCRLLAYVIKVSGCVSPEVELQGVSAVALKISDLVGIALSLEPNPDFSLERLQLQKFTAEHAALRSCQQSFPGDKHQHPDTRGRDTFPSSPLSCHRLQSPNKLDMQHCLVQCLQPALQNSAVLHVHLAVLHPLRGIVSLAHAPNLPHTGSQSLSQLSGELQHGVLAACELLMHHQSGQQGKLVHRHAASQAEESYITMAAVGADGALCSLQLLEMLGYSFFLLAISDKGAQCQIHYSKMVTADARVDWTTRNTARPTQLLVGKGATPNQLQSCLQASSRRIKYYLTLS